MGNIVESTSTNYTPVRTATRSNPQRRSSRTNTASPLANLSPQQQYSLLLKLLQQKRIGSQDINGMFTQQRHVTTKTVDGMFKEHSGGISQKGLDLIKEFEGERLDAYKCPAGVWTIGYGTTSNVSPGMKISKEHAQNLLAQDVSKFEDAVKRLVKVPLNQNQLDALVSFTYNLGEGNLAKSTLLKLLNQRDYAGAANEFGRFINANGKPLKGLIRRRAAEQALFETPERVV